MKLDLEIINRLKIELKKPLPGELARQAMAPSYRPQFSMDEIMARDPKVGAVLLLLYQKEKELYIILTQRKAYEGVHGGQMSLPGGKRDDEDADLVQTALRETEEEIGISAKGIEILGSLSELYIPPSNFLVHPVVGFVEKINGFVPQEEEVEKIVEIPLAFFINEKNIKHNTEIKLYNDMVVNVPAYIFETHIIWGATAIILSELIYLIKKTG